VFVLPAIVPRSLYDGSERGAQLGQKISGFYTSAAMSLLGRAVMVIRSNGGQVLRRSSYDGAHNSERTTLGGTTKKWRNPGGMMHTLANYPFALAFENRDILFDVRSAWAAEKYHENSESKGAG